MYDSISCIKKYYEQSFYVHKNLSLGTYLFDDYGAWNYDEEVEEIICILFPPHLLISEYI